MLLEDDTKKPPTPQTEVPELKDSETCHSFEYLKFLHESVPPYKMKNIINVERRGKTILYC